MKNNSMLGVKIILGTETMICLLCKNVHKSLYLIFYSSAGRNDLQNEVTNFMRKLGISDHHLEIEDAHSINCYDENVIPISSKEMQIFSLRGLEFRYIILCVTLSPKLISKTVFEEFGRKNSEMQLNVLHFFGEVYNIY